MDMETKLYKEIEETLGDLGELDPASKEYATAVDSVTKLMDRANEIKKLEMTESHNERQVKEERKSRLVKNLIDAGAIALPLAASVWMALVSLKFEEQGSITTTIGRKTLDKLFKK